MGKHQYSAEFEIRASGKILFPYLTTPAGLSQWFADEVNLDPDKNFNFIWDNTAHYARLTQQKPFKFVRFEFLSSHKQISDDPAFIEFRLEANEMTQSSFLKITDYSETENDDDLYFLWQNLVTNLREKVGG
jgi:hypothetical protein